jgi:hypothetical protein
MMMRGAEADRVTREFGLQSLAPLRVQFAVAIFGPVYVDQLDG